MICRCLMVRRRSCAVSNHEANVQPSSFETRQRPRSSRVSANALIAEVGSCRWAETRPLSFLFVLAVGLVAGTISGIVGTGSSIMLMPVLVYQNRAKDGLAIHG